MSARMLPSRHNGGLMPWLEKPSAHEIRPVANLREGELDGENICLVPDGIKYKVENLAPAACFP